MISTDGYKQQHVMCDTVSLDTRQTTLLYLVVYIVTVPFTVTWNECRSAYMQYI